MRIINHILQMNHINRIKRDKEKALACANAFLQLVLIAIALFLFTSQIYIATLLYKYEKSWWWGGLSFLLPFGLNVYIYQIIILENRVGILFEGLNLSERKLWRKIYVLVCMLRISCIASMNILISTV